MSVYLSPGVFPREIDLSLLPASQGALRPAFIGAAKKGPMNKPTLITTAAQFIDTFGEPIPESYLGYAVLAYLQEGNSCYVLRVGVEYVAGLDPDLVPDTIDVSGARTQGWGRIPLFSGIDHGTIRFRKIDTNNPVVIHAASTTVGTPSAANTSLGITGTYTGAYDDAVTILITGDASGTDGIGGATYSVSNQAGTISLSGTLDGSGGSEGQIPLNSIGLVATITATAGKVLQTGDSFTFTATPNNRNLSISVEGVAHNLVLANGTYSSNATFKTALESALAASASNGVIQVSSDLVNSAGDTVVGIRTTSAGEWIQVTGGAAVCAELGISQYAYDIPRSHLIAAKDGPFNFSAANNQVTLDVIGASETTKVQFTIPVGTGVSSSSLATIINNNGVVNGVRVLDAMPLTIPGGTQHVMMLTPLANMFDQLRLKVSHVNLATMRFSAELGVAYPYTKAYRSFADARSTLPETGVDGVSPQSCVLAPGSSQCLADTDYYENIVGWFVAKHPGTWSSNHKIRLELDTTKSNGDLAGRYKVSVLDGADQPVDVVQDVSFDPADSRYIGNVVNEGSVIGGVNGNSYYQWESRPATLGATSGDPASFLRAFTGGANGIPSNPTFSEELDNAVVGNPALASGLYSLQNPEAYDFNLLATPGFSSGNVIANCLQFAENRGDVLYLVDPPFGFRPQQIIEWHNGMLTSDLTAAVNSSYGALYWSWLKIADQFNGGSIWVPPSGHAAAIFARTERDAEQWFAPAGLRRGRVLSALDVEYNPTLGERDALYGSGNAVNPIVNFVRDGITIWGQRTLSRTSSALDRINVRMLLIFIKKNLAVTLRNFVFEQNDRITRAQVLGVIRPFLGDIAARRGLTAFNVVCDETNNTPERIDRNELWISVFLQPTRAIEFIALNLVTLRTGASFSAQEVLAAGGVVVDA